MPGVELNKNEKKVVNMAERGVWEDHVKSELGVLPCSFSTGYQK